MMGEAIPRVLGRPPLTSLARREESVDANPAFAWGRLCVGVTGRPGRRVDSIADWYKSPEVIILDNLSLSGFPADRPIPERRAQVTRHG
jgi:hypothetical protein